MLRMCGCARLAATIDYKLRIEYGRFIPEKAEKLAANMYILINTLGDIAVTAVIEN